MILISVCQSQSVRTVHGIVIHATPRMVSLITWINLIVNIVSSPEFTHISQLTIQSIIDKVSLITLTIQKS